jgi:hypothetical protein
VFESFYDHALEVWKALRVPGLRTDFEVLEVSGFHHAVVDVFALLGSHAVKLAVVCRSFGTAQLPNSHFADCSYLITFISRRVNENTEKYPGMAIRHAIPYL